MRGLVSGVVFSLWCAALGATSFIHRGDIKNTRAGEPNPCVSATIVLDARVQSKRSEEINGKLFTLYTLQALDWVRGQGSSPETLMIIGGQVGDRIAKVPGAPQFETGRYIFCANRDARTGYLTLASWAGSSVAISTDGQVNDRESKFKKVPESKDSKAAMSAASQGRVPSGKAVDVFKNELKNRLK